MSAHDWRRPNPIAPAATFHARFEGRIYALARPRPSTEPEISGWSGWTDSPTGLALSFQTGRGARAARVEVEHKLDQQAWHRAHVAMHLVTRGLVSRLGKLRYPFHVTLERTKTRISVDGRSRVFTTYVFGRDTLSTAAFGAVDVLVSCPRTVLKQGIELRVVDEDELDRVLEPWRRKDARLARQAARAPGVRRKS